MTDPGKSDKTIGRGIYANDTPEFCRAGFAVGAAGNWFISRLFSLVGKVGTKYACSRLICLLIQRFDRVQPRKNNSLMEAGRENSTVGAGHASVPGM